MALLYTRDNALYDFNGDDAYRAWLISRNAPPIVHHSGAMQWKRLRVLARRVKAAFAAMRLTVVAAKTRRLQRDLAFHGVRHDHAPRARTVHRGRP